MTIMRSDVGFTYFTYFLFAKRLNCDYNDSVMNCENNEKANHIFDAPIKSKAEVFFTKPWAVAVCAIFCCLLWGSAFPCVKTGYNLFAIDKSHAPSLMLFAGVRFTLAGVMVIAFGSIQKKKFLTPKPRNMWRVLVVALFQTCLQYTFFYIGLANVSGVKSSVINGLGVFFTILFACFIFRTEKFNLIKL